ncbi:MAG TPA: alpha/beta hydrolase [Lacisediminihabitans sp.]|uniref:alpha/beta fold hydrolase n=1 Tax=Lacisediminihabitans sp. TaxID=2787631 RepID=UPI002ED94317
MNGTTGAGWRRTAVIGGGVLAATAAGLAVLNRVIDGYVDPWKARVADAGFSLKTTRVGDVELSYAEGPDNGPALVLLHAQHMDWFSYSRVLPALSRRFHVFDIDYPGHGTTVVPADYPMTANRIGSDLATFIETTIGEPAFVTGNSSGGLLTTWLAANRPDLVRAVVLEDPPLFSGEYPRIMTTIADRSFATCSDAVREGVDDFLLYWIDSNKAFFTKNMAPGSAFLLTQAVKAYRRAHPGEPVEIGLLPDDTVRLFLRGMDQFDPRFGAAFHEGTWNAGFDHAEALAKVACPALLVQAEFSILPDGTLNGAMSQEDADRAMSLLPDGSYRRVEATHVVHLAEPELYTDLLEEFFLTR